MSRRGRLDAVVAGGGVVGAAAALMLARDGLRVALVEPRRPAPWQRETRDLRVFAFAPDNAALLQDLGAWRRVLAARAQPYRRMQVWDAAGGNPLVFDADTLGQPQLGWIVENGVLVDALWQGLAEAGVRLHCPAQVVSLDQDEGGVRVGLDDGLVLDAGMAIAADGGRSTLRELAGIEVRRHDYGQQGVVAFVASDQPHASSCWQRFLPTGPVALLPFAADGQPALEGRLGSIVWTLPDEEARRLLAVDAPVFARELAQAFGGELGKFELKSERAGFPLQRQLASAMLAGRVLVMGDAAHVLHPLAGQGVNLGVRDVTALRDAMRIARARGADPLGQRLLQRWARTRRSEATLNAHAMGAINRVYSNDAPALTLLRGHALGIAGVLPPLSRALWRHAAGV